MRMILIRHGETHANALYETEQRILIGALDEPICQLNDVGIQQAKNIQIALNHQNIDKVYCSDLGRTRQTALLIFPHKNIQYTSLLRERSLGSDEGKLVKELFSRDDIWNYHVNVDEDTLEDCLSKKVLDGESYEDVIKRCKLFLSQFNVEKDTTIAIVSHFHFIRCFIYVLLNKEPDREMFKMMIPNATPIVFNYNHGIFELEK